MVDPDIYIGTHAKKYIKGEKIVILPQYGSFFKGVNFVSIRAGTMDDSMIMTLGYIAYEESTGELEIDIAGYREVYHVNSLSELPTILKNLDIHINSIGKIIRFQQIDEILDRDADTAIYKHYADVRIMGEEYYYVPGFINTTTNMHNFPKEETVWESVVEHGDNLCGKKMPRIQIDVDDVSYELLKYADGAFIHAGSKFGKNSFIGTISIGRASEYLANGIIGTPRGIFYIEDFPIDNLADDACSIVKIASKIASIDVLEKEYPVDIIYMDKKFYAKAKNKLVEFDNLQQFDPDFVKEYGFI